MTTNIVDNIDKLLDIQNKLGDICSIVNNLPDKQDFSVANVTSEDILESKIAYSNLGLVVGNYENIYNTIVNQELLIQNLSNVANNMTNSLNNKLYLSNKILVTTGMRFQCSSDLNLDIFDFSKLTDASSLFSRGLYREVNLNNLDTRRWSRISYLFYNSPNVTDISISNCNMSNVTNIESMVSSCYNLVNFAMTNCNMCNVTNMGQMCYGYGRKLINFDMINCSINSVNNMYGMFEGCYNLVGFNFNDYNVANVTDITRMFEGCNKLSDNSIDRIINMVLNASNVTYKNLAVNNGYSPFLFSNITNDRYQNRWTELTTAGWTF